LVGLREYIFTDRDRVRLRAWLESRVEDAGTRMLFAGVRRSLGRIAADVGLMVDVARGLRSLDGWEGRARLPRCLARGKWWPLTRNSGGVSDALGSVWCFTCFCVCVELIYIGVFGLHAFLLSFLDYF
jgi:hypothetical protein